MILFTVVHTDTTSMSTIDFVTETNKQSTSFLFNKFSIVTSLVIVGTETTTLTDDFSDVTISATGIAILITNFLFEKDLFYTVFTETSPPVTSSSTTGITDLF
jgi:hypothetical protein